MRQRKLVYAMAIMAVVIALFFVIGCSKRQLVLTPIQEADRVYYEQKLIHTDALKRFVRAQIKYNLHYDAADPTTQRFFRAEVDPLWLQASECLDIWDVIIEAGQPGENAMENYKVIKTRILLKLPDLIWE